MKQKHLRVLTSISLSLALVLLGTSWARAQATTYSDPGIVKWGLLSAALVAGIGTVAAAIAVAVVGAAALGALSEKPELAGRALIFLGLAEGLAIYSLIIAIMILSKI